MPVVAIVGRPNVGKSSLFNWLAGRRIAIVDPTAGVTRARLSAPMHAGDRFFDLVDARSGPMALDEEVARRLRHVTCPVICVANKADTPEMEPQAAEFYKFGH